MSASLYLALYGPVKKLTMRQYADSVYDFLSQLQVFHPAFIELFAHSEKPGAFLPVGEDLSNLDSLIYKHSWDKHYQRKNKFVSANSDGSPTWETPAIAHYTMSFSTGATGYLCELSGDIDLVVSSGDDYLPQAVNLCFPLPDNPKFSYAELLSQQSLQELLSMAVKHWRPNSGVVTTPAFRNVVEFEYGSDLWRANYGIGWINYLAKPIEDSLPSEIPQQPLLSSALFWLNSDLASILELEPSIVQKAMDIRDTLASKGLLTKVD